MNTEATEKKKDQSFLSLIDLYEELKMLLPEGIADSKPVLRAGELRNLLDRVLTQTEITLRHIKAEIISALVIYKEHNETGDGVPIPQLWTHCRRGGAGITLPQVESAVSELLRENKIYARRNGLTTYLPGKDPDLDMGEDEAQE